MKQIRDFDLFSIILHWITAFLFFILFGLGLYMVELSYYDQWYKGSTDLHKSLGLSFGLLLLIRISWRTWVSRQMSDEAFVKKSWDEAMAYWVQLSMYLCMIILTLSGYMVSTAGDREVGFFGWFSLPPLWLEINQQEELAGRVHLYIAWGLIGLISLHIAGALKHYFIDRDKVFMSMLKPVKIRREK